jgi:ribonuclease BN (tRNA processing enzyme)
LLLTVVGSSCSIPRPGRACSSYLIEGAGRAVVADLGSGAYAKLAQYRSAESIDAVVISHMHADHFLDVIPMRYALKYGRRTNDRRVALYLPPEGDRMLAALAATFARESDGDFIEEVFDVRTYEPREPLPVGDLALRFASCSHYIPTFALRCDFAGTSVAYSADTAPDERVIALARGADAFVCEATLAIESESELPRGHSSAREAAAMALRAGVKRLVLSHYPAAADPSELLRQARTVFEGPVTVADDGLQLVLPRAG